MANTNIVAETARTENKSPSRGAENNGNISMSDLTEGEVVKKKKKRNKNCIPKKKLILNVAWTKYSAVRFVGKSLFKMRLTCQDDEDWDICWQDGAV
jgi:hypothetical protein